MLVSRAPQLPPCNGPLDDETVKLTGHTQGWQLFDSVKGRDHEVAAAICATCPIFDWCEKNLEETIEMQTVKRGAGGPEGTVAGRLFNQSNDGAARPPAKCGTLSGRRKHYRHGTKVCGPCKAAHKAEQRRLKALEGAVAA